MPIKIYHGPPGSYKSAAAVWDDVTRCAKEGRVLVTNVRGMTEERCATHLPEVSPGFRVMHFDMSKKSQLDVLRRWHWWAPFGAFFVLDEVQALYPPGWTAKEFRELDAPPKGNAAARSWPSGEAMPTNIEVCWDMHRHGNWDFTFTTPNIRKVRSEIRQVAEWAFKHKNLSYVPGFGGRFLEVQHLAEDNGSPSDTFASRVRKVPPYVFNLYDSTATGSHTQSKAGGSIFTSPKFLGLCAVLAAGVSTVASLGVPSIFRAGDLPEAPAKLPAAEFGAPPGHDPTIRVPPQSVRFDGVTPAATAPKPAPATAPAVAEPVKERQSQRWRLVGVLIKRDGTGVALLSSSTASRRVDAKLCRIVDGLTEWVCQVDGELVSRWTGGDPIGAVLGNTDAPG